MGLTLCWMPCQLQRHCKPWRFHGTVFTAPWEEFLGKWEGSVVNSSILNDQCSWAFYVTGSKGQLRWPWLSQWQPQPTQARLLLAADWWFHLFFLSFAHFLRPQLFVARSLEFFLYYVRILSNSPKPKFSNYPRKKASPMPIKMKSITQKNKFQVGWMCIPLGRINFYIISLCFKW